MLSFLNGHNLDSKLNFFFLFKKREGENGKSRVFKFWTEKKPHSTGESSVHWIPNQKKKKKNVV